MMKTSHFAIFDYWKDKCIDCQGNVKENIPENFDGTIEVVTDWYEPECWCCGKCIPVEKENDYLAWLNEDKLSMIWNCKTLKHHTNRAHIVPQMLGGEDKPENLFLVCESCHKMLPDLSDRKMFLSCVYDYRTKGRTEKHPFNVATSILQNNYNIKFPIVYDDENINQTKIGQHAGGISGLSFVYKIVSDTLERKTELREDIEKMFLQYLKIMIDDLEKEESSEISKAKIEAYKDILHNYYTFKKIEKYKEE